MVGQLRRVGGALSLAALLLVGASCGPVAAQQQAPGRMVDMSMLALDPPPPPDATPGHPVLSPEGLYIPSTVASDGPVPVLLALHGMGGTGPRIAQRLRSCAEANGWVLVAPTINYRDYMDPRQVVQDDAQDLPRLRSLLDDLPARLGSVQPASEVFVYGFSRGAQMAHRFALFYPDRVAGVAALSAGSYTVPREDTSTADALARFPYGVADLQQYAGHPFDSTSLEGMPFWIGVGAADTDSSAVPRGWDPLLGTTRVERGRRFAEALRTMKAEVSFNQFPGAGHEETAAMRARACDFLAAHTPLRLR